MQIQNANVHTPRTMRGAPNPTRGFIRQSPNVRFAAAACHPKFQNARFATAPCAKMYETSACSVGGRPRHAKTIVLPQFRTFDQREVTKRLPVELKNLHFTTVLDVRRARSDERVARGPSKFSFHHSFGRPTSTK